MTLASVPVPSLPPGELTAARLDPLLCEWARSPALRALTEASGWPWPDERDTGQLLERLAELSATWDFRAQRERNFIESGPPEVNGRIIPDDLVVAAARSLGLVDAGLPPAGRFSAVVVLSGLVSACVNRTRRATELLRDGVETGSVAILGGHRELGGKEPAQASEQGFGDVFDEAEVVLAATRAAFRVGAPDVAEQSIAPPPAWDTSLWSASARYLWTRTGEEPALEVVVSPSSEPEKRRANTADQLRHWAELAGIGSSDRVLLVTSQIYVPFQQFDALRVLGLERGCSVTCCGVDARTAIMPMRAFGGRDYLQEVRSALIAASSLLAVARGSGH